MKIVIAPDSFKESLNALSVAKCIEKGFKTHFPDADYVLLPLADGGEGTVEVLLQNLPGKMHFTEVQDPLGHPINAMWAMLDSKTALIEIASASGLSLLSPEERKPTITSTFGTGQLIRAALDKGAKKLLIGLGGSATNDGGAGILQALGAKLLDNKGHELQKGGAALSQLADIDLSSLDSRCQDVEMIVACDVDNPLCGAHGASHVFGQQKGASAHDRNTLDSALSHFFQFVSHSQRKMNKDVSGFGAAGGTPLGLSVAFNIEMQSGIEMLLNTLHANERLQGADLVITGEGKMDNQTLQGKAPYGIAKRAQTLGIPVIGVSGSLGTNIDELYSEMTSVFSTVRSAQPLEQVLQEAEANLITTARNIAATLHLGKLIL